MQTSLKTYRLYKKIDTFKKLSDAYYKYALLMDALEHERLIISDHYYIKRYASSRHVLYVHIGKGEHDPNLHVPLKGDEYIIKICHYIRQN